MRNLRKVLRQEKKFLINNIDYYKHSALFKQVLIEDEHNGYNGYMVRSLYFDTINDQDYYEKLAGVEKRKKIRLRVYNPKDQFAYLEIKAKEGMYQNKRSLKVAKVDAQELIKGNYSVLLKYDSPFARECYCYMYKQNYRPKTVVEYRRKAFIAKENNIRLTFDSDIRSSETNFNIFDENLLLYPVFTASSVILEVKFNGFLLSYIKDLLDNVQKSELSVSKYCLARKVSLNYVF